MIKQNEYGHRTSSFHMFMSKGIWGLIDNIETTSHLLIIDSLRFASVL